VKPGCERLDSGVRVAFGDRPEPRFDLVHGRIGSALQ